MTSVHVAPDCSFRQSIYNMLLNLKKAKTYEASRHLLKGISESFIFWGCIPLNV